MSTRVLEALQARFGEDILETHSQFGDDTAVVRASKWKDICRFLREESQMGFDMLVDLCAVDYPDRDERFEVVLHLASIGRRHRVRLKTRVGSPEGEHAELDSVTDVWMGANWFERETFDLMGIVFRGHPDLRRILMYPEFVGHPLRKDYPAQKTQPLVPYRTPDEAGVPLEKLAPFGADEGMPFGRRAWGADRGDS